MSACCWRWPLARLALLGVNLAGGAKLALAQPLQPLVRRLDDPTRAKVLAALAGLVILGFAMVLLAWLGARIVQRYRHGAACFRSTPRPGEHDWARKPLHAAEQDERPDDRPPRNV